MHVCTLIQKVFGHRSPKGAGGSSDNDVLRLAHLSILLEFHDAKGFTALSQATDRGVS